jgi:hypothetical protein
VACAINCFEQFDLKQLKNPKDAPQSEAKMLSPPRNVRVVQARAVRRALTKPSGATNRRSALQGILYLYIYN